MVTVYSSPVSGFPVIFPSNGGKEVALLIMITAAAPAFWPKIGSRDAGAGSARRDDHLARDARGDVLRRVATQRDRAGARLQDLDLKTERVGERPRRSRRSPGRSWCRSASSPRQGRWRSGSLAATLMAPPARRRRADQIRVRAGVARRGDHDHAALRRVRRGHRARARRRCRTATPSDMLITSMSFVDGPLDRIDRHVRRAGAAEHANGVEVRQRSDARPDVQACDEIVSAL